MSRTLSTVPSPGLLAWLLALALLMLLPSSVAPVQALVLPTKKAVLIAIPARFEVAAPPTRVWSVLTSAEGFSALTGFEIATAERSRTFARVGDHVNAKVWSDTGRLVVTHIAAGRELRVAWEPGNASYVCAKRIILHPKGKISEIDYLDRYSDDQPNADATAARVAAATRQHIAAFIALASK
jgi:hypothetical protein